MGERRKPSLTLIPVDQRALDRLAQGAHIESGEAYEFPPRVKQARDFFDGRSTLAQLLTSVDLGRPQDIEPIETAKLRISVLRTILGSNAWILDETPWNLMHPENPGKPTEGYTVFANLAIGVFSLNIDTIADDRYTVETTPIILGGVEIAQILAGKQEESGGSTEFSESEVSGEV